MVSSNLVGVKNKGIFVNNLGDFRKRIFGRKINFRTWGAVYPIITLGLSAGSL